MENKNKTFMIILSFLPIFLFPVDIAMAAFLTIVSATANFFFIKDEKTLQHALKPIVLVLTAGLFYLSFNFACTVIDQVGRLFNTWFGSGFRNFLFDGLNIIYILTLVYLILFAVFAAISIMRDKDAPLLTVLVKSVLAGKMLVKFSIVKEVVKEQAEQPQEKNTKKKEEPEQEVLTEEEKE